MFKHLDVLNKNLSENFKSRIRIAFVTENDSIKALLVDCDDDVYAIGKDYNEAQEPFKLEGICKLGVKDFSFGRGHVLALTGDGNVFAWGQNDRHQCGNGAKEYVNVPTQLNFEEEIVESVVCGWDHSLALTNSGAVYSWGRNYTAQCGNGTRDNVKFPEKLVIGKVKSIVCGAGHSMALLDNGHVYGWGENGDGQLGLGRETHCERSPSNLTELSGIKKLACGTYHTMALSTDGRIYTCGYNEYGQLGIGNKERRHTPQKIESISGVIDIAALWCKEISVALKEDGKWYIWGQTNMGDWSVPTEVKYESINDAFALNVASVPVTYKCYVIEGPKGPRKESLQINIGKINFNAKNILGKGQSGTRVFRGLFDGKQPVAVKRIDFTEITEEEIQTLLSLHHPNLLRHYTTESDSMFRYIASELAQMTFEEYVEKKRNGDFKELNDITLLRQVSEGLSYLHSQGIIHCNIRPENVLISTPMRPKGDRKAMITDCNLSKTIPLKQISSLARADGWIAPEVLHSQEDAFEPQTVNDIFTLGCLFFYVLKDGHHPFGDQYHRLANVYDGNSNIDMLKNEESLCLYNLISAMIDDNPAMRPPIEAVIKHPIFWDSKTLLGFIGHVSNRIVQESKDNKNSSLLKILESRASDVTKNDWISIITQDLRKDIETRSYDGSLVRDLLRAIRNKQQHYDELLENVKLSLGPLPDKFASYFTQRFPLLLVHTYITVQYCKTENNFKDYYCDSFDFPTLPVI